MFRRDLAALLRAEGHDALRVEEAGEARGDDAEILEMAVAEERILITLDGHFGDWVVLPLSRHPGVVRVRIHPTTTGDVAQLLVPFLSSHEKTALQNHLVIISRNRTRWVKTAD